MRKIAPFVFFGLLFAALIACAGNSQSVGQKIATQECVECHANLITCMKLGNDAAYWEKTIQRMADKDMDISPEEQKAVTDYLVSLEPGASPICD